MVNVFSSPKKRDDPEENKKQLPPQENPAPNEEQPLVIIQKLKLEEYRLAEEKQNLTQLKEQLQKKINDKIEFSKANLQRLKSEIDELKVEVAHLNETLEQDIIAE
jgi:hypothetical protein